MSQPTTSSLGTASNLMSFDQAIKDSGDVTRHLLLGNGFSIEFENKFNYTSLYEEANLDSRHENIFDTLGVKDFETIIRHLEAAAKLANIYSQQKTPKIAQKTPNIAQKMEDDAEKLKEKLVEAISNVHPDLATDIDTKVDSCHKFLKHFIACGQKGHVFTLNYDLLLYWARLRPTQQHSILKMGDGFHPSRLDSSKLVWQDPRRYGDTDASNMAIYFLHGALHLFMDTQSAKSSPVTEETREVSKEEYSISKEQSTQSQITSSLSNFVSELEKVRYEDGKNRYGAPLKYQIEEHIQNNRYPVFVAEGTTLQKQNKIHAVPYLAYCLTQLGKDAAQKENCFFIHGHSLAKNDDHIWEKLCNGKFKKLYVGIFGKPNQEIIKKAKGFIEDRKAIAPAYPLEVKFYDSETAKVWG